MEPAPSAATHGLWAITAYFNPLGYARRLANYRTFRRHLAIPLVAVEWSWSEGSPFQLGPGDADVLIRVRSPDLMWQKERLLNVALAALPAECRAVAWLDCDIVFSDPAWAHQTVALLDRFAFLHLFDRAYELGPDEPLDLERPRHEHRLISSVRSDAEGTALDYAVNDLRRSGFSAGFAWAAGTELLKRHGFYDACVLGSGNRALHSAAKGTFDEVVTYLRMGAGRRDHYLGWARPFHDDVRGRVGCRPGEIHHLWHGTLERRRYAERHVEFQQFGFEPASDLVLDDAGCWRWRRDAALMNRFVEAYFVSRREDG